MEQDTRKLYQECDSGCKMAVDSIDQLLEYAKSNDLRELLCKYKRKHEEIERKAEMALIHAGQEGKNPGMAAEAFSWMTTKMKLSMDADDKKVAEILMNGCNMGIQSICKIQNQYCDASRECKDLAENLVRTEEELMKELKAYL